jgi:flagellar hook-length control protein FliK
MVHQVALQQGTVVDNSDQVLADSVSLGDEQGAPVFAANTINIGKESVAMPAKPTNMESNNTSGLSTNMTALSQQSTAMQQQNQSNQQGYSRQHAELLADFRKASTDATASASDSDGFSNMLTSLSSVTTAASVMPNQLANPLSLRHPQWAQDMGNRMQMMVSQRMREVEIKLDPAELGPVRIHLKMDEENKAHVTLSAQHGLTRDMLENALPRLRDMLAQQGIDIGSANVDSGSQHQASNQDRQQLDINKGIDAQTDAANPSSEVPVWKSMNGLVDHFA